MKIGDRSLVFFRINLVIAFFVFLGVLGIRMLNLNDQNKFKYRVGCCVLNVSLLFSYLI